MIDMVAKAFCQRQPSCKCGGVFLKYIVGYPIGRAQGFVDEIVKNKKDILEVYFSFGDLPNGRSALSVASEEGFFEAQRRQEEDLRRFSTEGIALNLLFNANCYGRDSQSRAFFNRIGDLTDHLKNEYALTTVTTSSLLIAKFIKENFGELEVRASVNMEIGSIEGISYVSGLFDSFYVKREQNRCLSELHRLRKWCDANGKQMYLLANSGCLNNCSAHVFHDNLVAHEAEISAMDNGYQFNGICRDFLAEPSNRGKWLQRTNFIRPEDIWMYEEIVPAVKLATRVNPSPTRVLNAYLNRKYRGSVMELLEPDHSGILYPDYIENSNFDADFATHVMNCNKNCEDCHFCEKVMRRACVRLSQDPSVKA